MNNIDWKDVLIRAAKTFVEVAVAGLGALAWTDWNLDNVKVIVLSAGAAAISVIWNTVGGVTKTIKARRAAKKAAA